MAIEPVTMSLIALAVSLASLVGLGLSVAHGRRLAERLIKEQGRLAAMENDLRSLCNASVAVGERVNELERRLQQVADRQETLDLRQDRLDLVESEGRPFEQAIKLVHKGADVGELMDLCALTRGEAELILMMHRMGKAV